MSTRKRRWGKRVWNWKGRLGLVGVILGIVVGFLVWNASKSIGWGSISGLAVALIPDIYTLFILIPRGLKVMKIGIRQAEIDILSNEQRIQRLLQVYNSQVNNLDSYFRTHVNSVSYKNLNSNIPIIIFNVKFFNLTVFKWRIQGCSLRINYAQDTCEVIGNGQCYRLPRQGNINVDTPSLDSCQPANCDIALQIDNAIADCLKKCAINKEQISYRIPIIWKLQPRQNEEIESHDYPDELSYDEIPNLSR